MIFDQKVAECIKTNQKAATKETSNNFGVKYVN